MLQKQFMEFDQIMFTIIFCQKKITLWGDGAIVKNLTPQCGSEEFKSPHL